MFISQLLFLLKRIKVVKKKILYLDVDDKLVCNVVWTYFIFYAKLNYIISTCSFIHMK